MTTTIAMIGLGKMGRHMANHAVRAGHAVRVFDISSVAIEEAVSLGATAALSPAEAAAGADIVGIVVFDDTQTKEAVAGPQGVLTSLSPGAVVVIHTTVALETIQELAALADARGVELIDAGISGGEPGAEKGTLITMVGGAAEAVTAASPLFDAYSREVVHAGPLGAGMALKLARNAVGYAMMVAVHEAMQLVARSGIEQDVLARVLEATDVAGQAMAPFTLGGPSLLPADGPPELRSMLQHTRKLGDKDLDQALALAAGLGLELAAMQAVRRDFHLSVRLP